MNFHTYKRWIFGLMLILWLPPSHGHQLSTGYLKLTVDQQNQQQFNGQLQIRLFDLERSVGIDADQNGTVLWQEVLLRQSAISDYIRGNLVVSSQYTQCVLGVSPPFQAVRHLDEGYLHVNMIHSCDGNVQDQTLEVDYRGIFTQDADHKLLLNIEGFGQNPARGISAVLASNKQSVEFEASRSYVLDTFLSYLYQGVVHILMGTDHILFLVVLLLSCVLRREDGKWTVQNSLSPVLKKAAWIVTAFTLAHSITLTATALGWLSPNIGWVEIGIAMSVLLTAMNNIWPLVVRLGWITFAFGLLHGVGFASVLSDLGLSSEHQLVSILAFNLGVELGQLGILLVVLPLLFLIRNFSLYSLLVLKSGSFIIGLVALNWAIQRL
jgi:hypothetical protein